MSGANQTVNGAVTISGTTPRTAQAVAAMCPLRPGQPCTLCHPEAFLGPQDCPTVAIVMDDDDLRSELARRRAEYLRGLVA